MSKVIVYGFENDKLWFGRPTRRSWRNCFNRAGGMLVVKPIKGFEEYAYYSDYLNVSFEYCSLTNETSCLDPLTAVLTAERRRTGVLSSYEPYNKGA